MQTAIHLTLVIQIHSTRITWAPWRAHRILTKGESSSAAIGQTGSVDYATVLARYVASLDKENRTPDILALYANEIKKYGDEQGLYEQMLQWLGPDQHGRRAVAGLSGDTQEVSHDDVARPLGPLVLTAKKKSGV